MPVSLLPPHACHAEMLHAIAGDDLPWSEQQLLLLATANQSAFSLVVAIASSTEVAFCPPHKLYGSRK